MQIEDYFPQHENQRQGVFKRICPKASNASAGVNNRTHEEKSHWIQCF